MKGASFQSPVSGTSNLTVNWELELATGNWELAASGQ
jgi:hypothetical protein